MTMRVPKFGFILALLGLTSTAWAADVPKEPTTWTVSGHLRPRAEFRYNNRFVLSPSAARYTRNNHGDLLTLRSRVALGFDGRRLDGYFQMQHVSLWGATGGDQTNDPGVGMHQAYMTWSPVPVWWLQVGRFEVAYGDQRVLGAPGWNQTGRSWDGVRTGWWLTDDTGLDAFVLMYDEGAFRPAAGYDGRIFEDDSMLTGLYLHASKLSVYLPDVDVYALGDIRFDRPRPGPQRQVLAVLGARLHNEFLVVEGAYQGGSRCVPVAPVDPETEPTLDCEDETVPVSAGFFDTELGVKFGKVRPFLGGGLATGDNPDTDRNEAYFHMYPKAHKWLGFMDLVGARTNVAEVRAGIDLKLGKFTLRESIHYFEALRPVARGTGVELDTTVSYRFHDMFLAQAGHGLFIPLAGASLDPSEQPSGVGSWWYVQLSFDASATF